MSGALPVSPARAALVGLAGLASAMGVGRFAFTPLLPLMQEAGTLSLAEGGSLARANYLGYLVGAVLCMALGPSPGRAARAGLAAVAALTAGMGLTGAFPAWVALRLLAGVASAFVLVGVSAWALPLLAVQGRPGWSGLVYAGVGCGIFLCGLVGLAAGVLAAQPASAWLLLAAGSAAVALLCWAPLGATSSVAAPPRRAPATSLPRGSWRPVLAYGAFGFGYIVPATFLPAAARQVVSDPAVFAWVWPVFGVAAAASTAAVSSLWSHLPPRKLWVRAQVAMAAGVLVPALRTDVSTLLACALCVGGTFMVVTMAGIQEARRLAGASAPRLIAAMTAAFAIGQLVGPFTVTSLDASSTGGLAFPHTLAAAVLLIGLVAMVLGPRPAPLLTAASGSPRSPEPGGWT